MLTVEAHRLSHTDDVFHLVVPAAITKPLLFYNSTNEDKKVKKVDLFACSAIINVTENNRWCFQCVG